MQKINEKKEQKIQLGVKKDKQSEEIESWKENYKTKKRSDCVQSEKMRPKW